MSQHAIEENINKYAPWAKTLLFKGGVSIFLSLLVGLIYATYFISVSPDLAIYDQLAFLQGLGIGYGIIFSFSSMYNSPSF